jgi:hypothetical protein
MSSKQETKELVAGPRSADKVGSLKKGAASAARRTLSVPNPVLHVFRGEAAQEYSPRRGPWDKERTGPVPAGRKSIPLSSSAAEDLCILIAASTPAHRLEREMRVGGMAQTFETGYKPEVGCPVLFAFCAKRRVVGPITSLRYIRGSGRLASWKTAVDRVGVSLARDSREAAYEQS